MQNLKRPLLAFAICLIFGLMGTLKAQAPAAPATAAKGQIKPEENLRAVDSPKKRMNEFVLFFCLEK